MNELIRAAMDWPRQMADFESDGILGDIYVEDTTVEDWALVVARLFGGNYGARLEHCGAPVAVPVSLDPVFAGEDYLLSFTVGSVVLTCHFFTPSEIEFSFAPHDASQPALYELLVFMGPCASVTVDAWSLP